MGGFMFIISTIITSIGGYWIYRLNSGIDVTDSESFHPFYRMLSCVVFAALFGLIGFIDDYTKVARKDNRRTFTDAENRPTACFLGRIPFCDL